MLSFDMQERQRITYRFEEKVKAGMVQRNSAGDLEVGGVPVEEVEVVRIVPSKTWQLPNENSN